MASNFKMAMNGAQFRKEIEKKREGIRIEVQKEVKASANGVLGTLRGNLDKSTSPARSFTAVRTVAGQPTTPITVKRGTVRESLNKRSSENIFEVDGYEAKIGSRNKVLVNFLEDGTRAHGPVTAKLLRFATPNGVVFTKWVKGIRPMKVFKRTFRTWNRIFPKLILEAARRGLNK